MPNTINYITGIESDSVILFHNLKGIKTGFYLREGWYPLSVLNFGKTASNTPTVFFPEISYTELLKVVINCAEKLTNFTPEELKSIDAIKDALKPIYTQQLRIDPAQIKRFKADLSPIINKTLERMQRALVQLQDKNFVINVHLTKLGTHGSFEFANLTDSVVVIDVWLRIDQPVVRVAELIVSSITRTLSNVSKQVTWRETEAVSDFFVTHVIGYKNFAGTLESVSLYNATLLSQALNFMYAHDIPFTKIITYRKEQNKIYVLGKDISSKLGPYEFRLLRALIINANRTVSYVELSHELYKIKPVERFSLWGIAKLIQRVRDHLEVVGIPREYIKTVRGEGVKLLV